MGAAVLAALLPATSGAALRRAAQPSDINELHPEAVTMKTWVNLKESIEMIRGEVINLLSVKDEVAHLQSDLKTQEEVWHTAETDLTKDNAELIERAAALRAELRAKYNGSLWEEVQALGKQVEEEKRMGQSHAQEAEHDKKQEALERSFYQERRDNISAMLRQFNSSVDVEVQAAHQKQLQLETDAVALALKSSELGDRLTGGAEELARRTQVAAVEALELQRQLGSMRDGMARVEASLHNSLAVNTSMTELGHLQAELKDEVATMVTVQQEQARLDAQCARLRTERSDAMCAEKRKAEKRQHEANTLCSTVRGQVASLHQMLAECELPAAAW